METTKELVAAVRAIGGSDNRSAPLVGVSQNSFTEWRNGTAFPTDEYAIKIAELLKLDPAFVLAVIRADRAKSAQAIQRLGLTVREAFSASNDFEPLLVALIEGLKPEDYKPPF